MNVCVLSLCRDRLEYTRACFASLLENAGCDFDWLITDNGSSDGTAEWLIENTDATVYEYADNIGINPALNRMLDDIDLSHYDVICKIDNDCELVDPDTVKDICTLVMKYDAILSPTIRGLREPPVAVGQIAPGITGRVVVGGIFMAIPAWIFQKGYRHPILATKDGDDWTLCQWYRNGGGLIGYVDGYTAWHYRTTDGQHLEMPEYFARRQAEREAVAA